MSGTSYSVTFNENDQEIAVIGTLRPRRGSDMGHVSDAIVSAAQQVTGTLHINFKRLQYLSNTAFIEIARALQRATASKPTLKIKVIVSSVVPWSLHKLQPLVELNPSIALEQYDKKFYPGQRMVENQRFIPVLRTQTKLLWVREKDMLVRHGLRKGMKVADICCGIGDFAALIHKEFEPAKIVAVDHSKPSLEYAREVAHDFGIDDIDFQYGEATNLLIQDNSFDFVMCRLSLQVFDKPEQIVQELFRICAPGGRIYLTNEMYSQTFGFPHHKSIAWTYREASKLYASFGMDLEFGQKMRGPMIECRFEDIRIEPMMLTNLDTDTDEFVEVIRSWQDYATNELAVAAERDEEFRKQLESGFQDHIDVIASHRGFAGWPIWIASGRKPDSKEAS